MSLRRWLIVPAFIALAACGDKSDAANGDSATGEAAADVEDTGAAAASPVANDSIPMEITVTVTGGRERDGTYTARGMGDNCSYNPDAKPGVTQAAWHDSYGSADTAKTAVSIVTLAAGATANDRTDAFTLRVIAGTMDAGGVRMPAKYEVGTFPTGTKLGSGTVTVHREGEGARFDISAVDGDSKARLEIKLTCAKLGRAS